MKEEDIDNTHIYSEWIKLEFSKNLPKDLLDEHQNPKYTNSRFRDYFRKLAKNSPNASTCAALEKIFDKKAISEPTIDKSIEENNCKRFANFFNNKSKPAFTTLETYAALFDLSYVSLKSFVSSDEYRQLKKQLVTNTKTIENKKAECNKYIGYFSTEHGIVKTLLTIDFATKQTELLFYRPELNPVKVAYTGTIDEFVNGYALTLKSSDNRYVNQLILPVNIKTGKFTRCVYSGIYFRNNSLVSGEIIFECLPNDCKAEELLQSDEINPILISDLYSKYINIENITYDNILEINPKHSVKGLAGTYEIYFRDSTKSQNIYKGALKIKASGQCLNRVNDISKKGFAKLINGFLEIHFEGSEFFVHGSRILCAIKGRNISVGDTLHAIFTGVNHQSDVVAINEYLIKTSTDFNSITDTIISTDTPKFEKLKKQIPLI